MQVQRPHLHAVHAQQRRRAARAGVGQRLQQVGRGGGQHGAVRRRLLAARQQQHVVVLARLAQRVERGQRARRQRRVLHQQLARALRAGARAAGRVVVLAAAGRAPLRRRAACDDDDVYRTLMPCDRTLAESQETYIEESDIIMNGHYWERNNF